jgi:hypothetical protein
MSETFRPVQPRPAVAAAAGHAGLVAGRRRGVVRERRRGPDLSAIYAAYESGEGRGQPPYHPAMMVKLLLYGYGCGIASGAAVALNRPGFSGDLVR